MLIKDLLHPLYCNDDYIKWRLTYAGGRKFIDNYLEKYSNRESDDDFAKRKKISYCPAFAKASVNEVRDAIFQRMTEVQRLGGSKTYQDAIRGDNRGVTKTGMSMNNFMGTVILPEMCSMKRVGIFVDRDSDIGETYSESVIKTPYIYHYPAEAIRSWDYDEEGRLINVLLEDSTFNIFGGLPYDYTIKYKQLKLTPNGVQVLVYDEKFNIDLNDPSNEQHIISNKLLQIPEIPFHVAEISDSLLTDIADYQIALLNIASSDLGYILTANYPFYTEQYDPISSNTHLKDSPENKEAKIGVTQGRQYPKGLDRPEFIYPSAEPLTASMAKQDKLKEEIRLLLRLTLSNLTPTRTASAESKASDERSLENGLSYLGLELEYAERQIARFWAMYENGTSYNENIPEVKYPECYNLRSEIDVDNEVKRIFDIIRRTNILSYKKELMKRAVYLTLSTDKTKTRKLLNDIDSAVIIDEPESLINDLEAGLVDLETVSTAKGYPKNSVDKAREEHVDRLKRIAIAQSTDGGAARGIPDQSVNPKKEAKLGNQEQ